MDIKYPDVKAAIKAGLITEAQAEKLWLFWKKDHEEVAQFHIIHVLYYFGGLLAIAAITLFVTQAWDQLRGLPLIIIALVLFFIGLKLTKYFLKRKQRIPAGIFATFSLATIPLIVYNLQIGLGLLPPMAQNYHYSDFHYWINWYWIPMELATLVVGAIMFYFYRFPFLLFPIAVVLWYMSMDLWPLLFQFKTYTWQDKMMFSMGFGLFILLCAIVIDFKYDEKNLNYAYWLYIVGVIIFWGGLSAQYSDNELSKFFYCMINVFMIFISVFLDRRVFAVFGAIGLLGYLGHLAVSIFADSLIFPIVLILLGLILIFIATKWTKIERKLLIYTRPYLPKKILERIANRN